VRTFSLGLLLLLFPSHANERVDCGFVPGERYWITTGGVVFPDTSVLTEWGACDIPEGVILSVRWDEAPGYTIEVYPACDPSPDEEAQIATLVEKARKMLSERGIDATGIPVRRMECSERRRVDVKRSP